MIRFCHGPWELRSPAPDRIGEVSWDTISPPKTWLLATSRNMLMARRTTKALAIVTFLSCLKVIRTKRVVSARTMAHVHGCVSRIEIDRSVSITNLDTVAVLANLRNTVRNR